MSFEKGLVSSRPTAVARMLTIMALSHGLMVLAASAESEIPAAPSNEPLSIWDRPIPGSEETRDSLALGRPNEVSVEPVLLPLPAPVIAAGVGLGVALLLRKRLCSR